MKIDYDIIKKIFNLEIKLTKEKDKIELSQYEDYIPMYDIYSEKIYPIDKMKIHSMLIYSHFRFVNEEIHRWIKLKYDKRHEENNRINLEIINNYDIKTLLETSYKTLYKYSPKLGLSISICKRNSFNKFIKHLKPYYTKTELIKLGQNMNLTKDNISLEKLIDQDLHYEICKNISDNDVSFEEIKKHHEYIKKENMIGWICFYSFIGSFLFNKYLRNLVCNDNQTIPLNIKNGLIKITQSLQNAPALEKDYIIYRFIWDDEFLHKLKEGDMILDKGFLSTTRDPFYSPGLSGNFGLVLLKIKIPKGMKGIGLFIENFSLFPKEEEFLIAPYSRLKLISKNDDFKYYHTDENFEKLINRKYEFELLNIDYNLFFKENKFKNEIINEYHDITNIELDGITRFNLIEKFIALYSNNNKINLKYENDKYSFNYYWFDSTENSSYSKFYHNKMKDGMLLSIFNENGIPYINIELGKQLVINHLNKFYFGETIELSENILNLILYLGKIFHYKKAIIFHTFKNFEGDNIFFDFNKYNFTIYNYLKNKIKLFNNNPFIKYDSGYWNLDNIFNKNIDKSIIEKLPDEIKDIKKYRELFIIVVEKYFYLYLNIIKYMDNNKIFNEEYITYNIQDQLVVLGLANNFISNIEYNNDDAIDRDFQLIFRRPIRRF